MIQAAKEQDFGAFKKAFMESFSKVDLSEGRELLDQLIESEIDDEDDAENEEE